MVTRNEMKEFKRSIKLTAGILVGFAVAFFAMAGTAHFAFSDHGDLADQSGGSFTQDENKDGSQDNADGQADGQDAENGGAQSGMKGADGTDGSAADGNAADKPVQNQEWLLLVNKTHPIGEDYKPDDLTSIKYYASDRSAESRYMRKEAAEHFHTLVEAAKTDGYEIVMTTAYRSYGFQSILYNNYVQKHGEAEANKFSAKPGQSEHQTGLCTDVSSPSVNYQLTTDYGEAPEGKWLAEHAHEFGFIIRFPLGKEDITGYQYEPWHIRYVGQPAADEIYEQGITLEEYLGED